MKSDWRVYVSVSAGVCSILFSVQAIVLATVAIVTLLAGGASSGELWPLWGVGAPLSSLAAWLFLSVEWFANVHTFYRPDGSKRSIRRPDGGYNVVTISDELTLAWLSHQRHKHHWQAWIAIGEGGTLAAVPIPYQYILEMIADWIGAGQSHGGTLKVWEWYEINRDAMILHPASRAQIEATLEMLKQERA